MIAATWCWQAAVKDMSQMNLQPSVIFGNDFISSTLERDCIEHLALRVDTPGPDAGSINLPGNGIVVPMQVWECTLCDFVQALRTLFWDVLNLLNSRKKYMQ